MKRPRRILALVAMWCALMVNPLLAQTGKVTIKPINRDDIKAMSTEKGTVIVGSLAASGHGHVVVGRPNSDRVWDGNFLGGFKDLVDGKPVTNVKTLEGLNRVINNGVSKGKLDIAKASVDQIRSYAERYEQEGGKISWSYDKTDQPKVQWYQVPTSVDVYSTIRDYTPPPAKTVADQNLRCNDLVQTVAPDIKRIVMDDNAISTGSKLTANQIDSALSSQAKAYSTQQDTIIQAPPAPPQTPIYGGESRELKVVPKPGGVIVNPIARIKGLTAAEVAKCELDPTTGKLTFHLKSGDTISFDTSVDYVVVAAKALAKGVDPSLSMETSDEVPGFHAVHYTGPLFKTRLGKVLFDADDLLGSIMFAYEGPHRSIVAESIPGYRRLSCESHFGMQVGSRVFLRAVGADFQVREGALVCTKLHTKVDVEGLGDSAAYYQESLHLLAREVDRNFESLIESFEQFQEFSEIVRAVAIAKWIKHEQIPFDWEKIQGLRISEAEVPAFAPSSDWYCLFNGENLDGWQLNLPSDQIRYSSEDGQVTLGPEGAKELVVLTPNWRNDFDLRFTLTTNGPVELILKQDDELLRAFTKVDTLGKPQILLGFANEGAWTTALGETAQKGTITPADRSKAAKKSFSGFRIPAGSTLTLFGASLRTRRS